jgi:hypothetical protein
MIRSFAWADIEALFHSRAVSRCRNIERVARCEAAAAALAPPVQGA